MVGRLNLFEQSCNELKVGRRYDNLKVGGENCYVVVMESRFCFWMMKFEI